jgi:hypothetical protein
MTKEKQKAVFEFIFLHKNRFDMWIASAFCTEPGVPNGNQYGVPFPFSLSEARSILVLLKEKGLMTEVGDIFGEPYYHIHQAKDTEWKDLIANTREIGWIERHRWTILKSVSAFFLFSASIIYTETLQRITNQKIDAIQKIISEKQQIRDLNEAHTNNIQSKNIK